MKRATLSFVAVILFAAGSDGCGGKTEADDTDATGGVSSGGAPIGGTSAQGGSGGTPSGGAGAQPSGGYGGVTSPCDTCPSYTLAGLLEMAACCVNGNQCGAVVSTTVTGLIYLEEGCWALGQPGAPTPICPPLAFTNPLDGKPHQWPGCCRPQGTCGVYVDLTPVAGPLLGCVDQVPGGGSPKKCGGSPGTCGACTQAQCSSEVAVCVSDPECLAIISCGTPCSDQACLDKCAALHPQGQAAYSLLIACVNQKCGSECAVF